MSIDVSPDVSPDGLRTRVETVIEVIRPAIQADDGDIVLHDVDEATGEVSVELTGACVTCPASDQTLKAGIERILNCLLYTSPSPRDKRQSRMPSSA